MKKVMFGMIICLALTAACKKSSSTPNYTPDCSGTTKSFSSDVMPLINNTCSGCHSNFSNYSQISRDKAAIRNYVVNGSMPQGGSMSAAQKNIIVCWIDNGALNN